VCTGRKLSGLRLPLFFLLFGAPKCNQSNNREGWCALALGGRCFNYTHNNQTRDGFQVTVDVGEAALPGRSVRGDVVSSLGLAVNSSETQQWMGLNWKVQTSSFESKCMPHKLDFYKYTPFSLRCHILYQLLCKQLFYFYMNSYLCRVFETY
jgi:hypothetical protein